MNRFRMVILFSMSVLFSSVAVAFTPGEVVVLAFPEIVINKGERIAGFELSVSSGHVTAISQIPKDWVITDSAEQSSQTVISGGCVHGAGAIKSTVELPKITVIVEKPIDQSVKFSAIGKISVTTDFVRPREIEVPFEKFKIDKSRI